MTTNSSDKPAERAARPARLKPPRYKRFNMNVTAAELLKVKRAAKRAGLTMASFVRQIVLAEAARIMDKVDHR